MSFFNKLKDGASKAADMAKDQVEIARLNTQISGKKKDVEKVYLLIGESVYNAYTEQRLDSTEALIQEQSEKIQALKIEIQQLEYKIKVIKNEKDCVCGNVVAMDAKFCPTCGNRFNEEAPPASNEEAAAVEEVVQEVHCSSCQAVVKPDDLFCESCGFKLEAN